MKKRVLLTSIELGCGYQRGIYHFTRSLIRAINKEHELGLLTHAYNSDNLSIHQSLNELNYYFYDKYKLKNRWKFYLKYMLGISGNLNLVHNMCLSNDVEYLKSINFFVNKPVFYFYNQQYLKIPGLRLHNFEIPSLSSDEVIFTSSPINIRSGKHRIIQTLHDVFPFISEDYYQPDFHRKVYGLTAADKIMAVSNYAKESFLKYYPKLENKIDVVYQSVAIDNYLIDKSKDKNLCELILKKYNLKSKQYMFFIGAIEFRKNVHNIVHAFKIAMNKNAGIKLVIAGRADDFMYLKKYDLLKYKNEYVEKDIQFIGELTNIEKVCLISNCCAFLFPSLLEGFGIPVIEAQTLGVPVLTSNNSALAETASGSALLINDPERLDELSNAIERLATDDLLCKELVDKGYENIKRFSFDKFSYNVNQIIKSI